MHQCSICGFRSANRTVYTLHIVDVHKHDPRYRVTCCGKQYASHRNFSRHLRLKHKPQGNRVGLVQEHGNALEEIEEIDNQYDGDNDDHGPDNPVAAHVGNDLHPPTLEEECGRFVLNLETKNIPAVHIDAITHNVTELFQMQRARVCESVQRDHGIDIGDSFGLSGMERLSTSYNRHKFFKDNFNLLNPVPIKYEERASRVYQYVPVISTLQTVLSSPQVRMAVESPDLSENGLCDVLDGDYVRNSHFFRDRNKLMIMAYYDDIEVVNPIGSKRKKHKLALFYWTLLNIPAEFRAQLRFIHLFAVAYTKDVKRFGVEAILGRLVTEMNDLQKDGVDINCHGETINYTGSLVLFVGDTPAANLVAGFKEGVGGAEQKCRTCYTNAMQMKSLYSHDEFTTRTLARHRDHCLLLGENMPQNMRTYYSKVYGINRLSVLDQIHGFDLTKCIPIDIMHILLEGALPYAIKGLLSKLIDNRLVTLKDLNAHMDGFKYKGSDAKYRPSQLERTQVSGLNTGKIGQSAIQTATLTFCLPFLLAEMSVDTDDIPEYRVFLMLLELTSMFMAYTFTRNEVLTSFTLVKQFLEVWCDTYGSHTLTPKMHYLVHVPYYIEKFGPPRATWCLRMEGKHSFFKGCTLRNFKNLPLSLSKKHQTMFCHEWTDAYKHNILTHKDNFSQRKGQGEPEIPAAVQRYIAGRLRNCNCVTISGFKYSVGYALRLDDEEFVFISQIVANDLSEAVLLVSDLVIEEFVPKLYSYSVTKARTPATRWILVKDLKHKHPLYVYTLSRSDTMYIQPRYFSQVEYVGIV